MLNIENLLSKLEGKYPYEYLGNQLLICGDCLDVMKLIDDKSVDLVLTDPPYGIGASTKSFTRQGKQTGKSKCIAGLNYTLSNWDNKIPEERAFKDIFKISKNQIIFGGNFFAEYLYNSSCWIVWDKVNGDNFYADCELAWTSFKTAIRKYTWKWQGMLQQNMKDKEKRIHPTQKPVGLFCLILKDYSKENDLILDAFAGSFTTSIACIRTGRISICIEKDETYFKGGVNRAKEELRQGDMLRCL